MRYSQTAVFRLSETAGKIRRRLRTEYGSVLNCMGLMKKFTFLEITLYLRQTNWKILSCCYIFLTWYRLYRITARSALNFLAIKNIRAVDVPTGLKPFSAQSLLTSLKKTAIACVRQQGKQVIFWKGWIKKWRFKRIGLFTALYLLFLVRSHDRSYIRHL